MNSDPHNLKRTREHKSHQLSKLLATLAIALLCSLSSLLLTGIAFAQDDNRQNTPTEVTQLIENLTKADEFNRDETIDSLVKVGAPAVPALIEALESDKLPVRQGALDALKRIDQPAVPASIEALASKKARVRWNAAAALGTIGYRDAEIVIPALVKLLTDSEPRVRRRVAESLLQISWYWQLGRQVPLAAKEALPSLTAALKDSDSLVRSKIALVLGNMRGNAGDAVADLATALRDPQASVRSKVALALGNLGIPAAEVAVTDLIAALADSAKEVRSSAAIALGNLKDAATPAVPELRQALQDSETEVRSSAAIALGNLGMTAASALPQLRQALNDREPEVRSNAAIALGNLGSAAAIAVPNLIETLQDPNHQVRNSAAIALGDMGVSGVTAIPNLQASLKDLDENVRNSAAESIRRIAISLQEPSQSLSPLDWQSALSNLQAALNTIKSSEPEFSPELIASVRLSIQALKAQTNSRIFTWVRNHRWLTGFIIYLLFFPSLWSIVLWLRPLWMLRINETLKAYEFKLPSYLGGAPIRPKDLLFFGVFYERNRVLDAWIAHHIDSVRSEFKKIPTVKQRSIYISLPVILEGETIAELQAENLQPIFAQERSCLIIWAEGGAGKTTLACQVGLWAMNRDANQRLSKHLMIPILIEEDLNSKAAANQQILLETIRRKLQDLSKKAEPISEELLICLLKHRRLLVILDRFSEMLESTRALIQRESSDINALVLTSRVEEKLTRSTNATIQPLRIAGDRLSSFMEAYLTQRGKRNLFTDSEFFSACIQLSKMVGDREITLVLAKLYAEQMIAAKERSKGESLPTNIPDLMLSYLNEINRDVSDKELDDRAVHQDAKAVAWACVNKTYHSATAKRKEAIAALLTVNEANAEPRLKYLENKLHLIETIGAAKEDLKFAIDPVAEYLAALYLVDKYHNDPEQWQEFFKQLENPPEQIKEFLFTLRDCYLAKVPGAKVSDFLPQTVSDRFLGT